MHYDDIHKIMAMPPNEARDKAKIHGRTNELVWKGT